MLFLMTITYFRLGPQQLAIPKNIVVKFET